MEKIYSFFDFYSKVKFPGDKIKEIPKSAEPKNHDIFVDLICEMPNSWQSKTRYLPKDVKSNSKAFLKFEKTMKNELRSERNDELDELNESNQLNDDFVYCKTLIYKDTSFLVDGYDKDSVYIFFKNRLFKNYKSYIINKGIVLASLLNLNLNINLTSVKVVIVNTGQLFKIKLPVISGVLNKLDERLRSSTKNFEYAKLGYSHGVEYPIYENITTNYVKQIYFKDLNNFSYKDMILTSRLKKKNPIFVHSPLNFNLAREGNRAVNIIRRNLGICKHSDFAGLVIHTGKGVGIKLQQALVNIKESVLSSLAYEKNVMLLLETPSGQGTELLSTIDDFVDFFVSINEKHPNFKVCVDTCHVFAAGYLPDFYLTELTKKIGVDKIKLIHFNDSVFPINCKRDKHAPAKKGCIPVKILNNVYRWCVYNNIPMVREY